MYKEMLLKRTEVYYIPPKGRQNENTVYWDPPKNNTSAQNEGGWIQPKRCGKGLRHPGEAQRRAIASPHQLESG